METIAERGINFISSHQMGFPFHSAKISRRNEKLPSPTTGQNALSTKKPAPENNFDHTENVMFIELDASGTIAKLNRIKMVMLEMIRPNPFCVNCFNPDRFSKRYLSIIINTPRTIPHNINAKDALCQKPLAISVNMGGIIYAAKTS